MTTKPVTKTLTTKKKTPLAKQDKQTDSVRCANASLSPATMSAILADNFTNVILPKAEIADVANVLRDKIATIQDGDMKSIEAMLIGQAQALQTMFVSLGRQAVGKTLLPQYTAFMNLALKAQSQSRATIQALVELKYPRQTNFVKQANIANGHQQINNGHASNETSTRTPAHTRENQTKPNELIEEKNGSETMDNKTAQTAIPKYKAMATVAAQHGC